MTDYSLNTETFEHDGMQFRVTSYHDVCMGEPWREHDGHGIVSDWTTRSKSPGEMVLSKDRNSKRYYDFQESVKIARRDGWNTEPYNWPTKGAQAHAATMSDFEYIKGWCNNEWCWITIKVELLDDSGDLIPDTEEYLGGIESKGDYWLEPAKDLAGEIVYKLQGMAA